MEVKFRTKGMPNMCAWGARYSVLTDWSTLNKDFFILGCEEELHFRVMYIEKTLPFIPYDYVTLFRARKGQLAVLVITRHLTEEDCTQALPFLRVGPLLE